MNWRQQLFDASPLSRLVALQQALIRINSHSIIFSLSKHLCISEPLAYSLNTQGQLLPSSMNRNSFQRLKVVVFSVSLSLSMHHVGRHTIIVSCLISAFLFICISIYIYQCLNKTDCVYVSFLCRTMTKAKFWIQSSNSIYPVRGGEVFGQHREVGPDLMSHHFHSDS